MAIAPGLRFCTNTSALREHGREQRLVVGAGEVEHEQFLAAVEPDEIARSRPCTSVVVAAREVALRPLDLDHARAGIGEPAGAHRRGHRLLQRDDEKAGQGKGHGKATRRGFGAVARAYRHGASARERASPSRRAAILRPNRNAGFFVERMARIAIIALMLLATAPALAEPAQPDAPPRMPVPTPPAPPRRRTERRDAASRHRRPPPDADLRNSVCLMIESAARANNLPLEFFARVIWQESRFQPGVVGPRTRSGERAQGIAQFMPRTAAERGLLDPFDPVQALPKSAEFLRELADQFGNLGLAAAAYNAGPQRVRDWLAGPAHAAGGDPQLRARRSPGSRSTSGRAAASASRAAGAAKANCTQLIALLHRAPNPFVHEARGAGDPRGRQPVGRAACRRLLARPCARELRRCSPSAMPRSLTGRDPSLLSSVLRSRGTRPFYQVRVGADTRQAADILCGSIRRAGGACIVLRNGAS